MPSDSSVRPHADETRDIRRAIYKYNVAGDRWDLESALTLARTQIGGSSPGTYATIEITVTQDGQQRVSFPTLHSWVNGKQVSIALVDPRTEDKQR